MNGLNINASSAWISGGSALPLAINAQGHIDVNVARPFYGDCGSPLMIVNAQGDTAPAVNALLQHQEWLDIDRSVITAMAPRLVGVQALRNRGLVHRLGSIGQTVSLWQTVSGMTDANISMSGVTAGSEDTVEYGTAQVPVPIVHKDFRIDFRRLQASRMFGESIDVTAASVAGRMVAEASEAMLFAGAPITVEGAKIYGYRTFPQRKLVPLGTAWTSAAPVAIKTNVQGMLQQMRIQGFHGNNVLYIPPHWEGALDEYYYAGDLTAGVAAPTRTIREVLLSLSGLDDIVVADILGSADEAVMVNMTRETVDIAIAQEPTVLSWGAMGGMVEHFKAMAVWVPRLKADFNGKCGIVHLFNV